MNRITAAQSEPAISDVYQKAEVNMGLSIHVAKFGKDINEGSLQSPLLTIQAAANRAMPGDTVVVHEGIYREHVRPGRGGTGPDQRIVYEAAPGEKVVISGGEPVTNWERMDDSMYKAVIDNRLFGGFNPFSEEVGGDWFQTDRVDHVGEVYINGKAMFEVASLDAVRRPVPYTPAREPEWSVHVWYAEVGEDVTTVYANFGEFDPTRENIEVNARKYCFFPERTGINYITVRGFSLTMAATNWAPPTAMQEGLLGPHWSKGWMIENNEISNSKNSGISLGKELSTGHNEWTRFGDKHGTQYQRDAVFKALHIGWSKETIGSHVIRNNVIHDCEQTGICGHLGAIFCEIYDNHIYAIHTRRMFGGAEIGGIKLHAAIDTVIRNNHVHNCDRGFWMDWQAQGTRITRNLMYDNDIEDIYIEVSHGPYLIDNNILLSMKSIKDMSHGGAYVHNLFGGFLSIVPVPDRFTPYHFPHETAVLGVVRIMCGDNRFYNNIFLGTQDLNRPKEKRMDLTGWYHGGIIWKEDGTVAKGLASYDSCPTPEEWSGWCRSLHDVLDFAAAKLPVFVGSNLYFGDATMYAKGEAGSVCVPGENPQAILKEGDDGVFLSLDFGGHLTEVTTQFIDSAKLGEAFEPRARFENPDSTDIVIDTDFFGAKRNKDQSLPGPFSSIAQIREGMPVGRLK
ncbi:MAG: right-handed parallel beta-helix repeat-containing protein [Clostridiaceae bacterium]|nr:right-handed parallel beta-helix repeat-containing protein [Clostridiaceae bacterium]